MSAPTPSNEARDRWIALNARLLDNLKEDCGFDETVSSEKEFQAQFRNFPNVFHSSHVERDYGTFIRCHGQVVYMVKILDEALQLDPPHSLCNVFWTYALAALRMAIRHAYEFKNLAPMYEKLNGPKDIPVISSDLPQFPQSVSLQEPLQTIFETYIDVYLVFVHQYAVASEHRRLDRQPILDKIAAAAPKYSDAESRWRDRLQEAMIEREKNISNQTGQPAAPDDSAERDARFRRTRHLGTGAYGIVDEIYEVSTGTVYARKSIPRKIPGQKAENIEERVRNEVDIMSKLRHNHVASVNMFFKGEKYWDMIMLPVADCDLRFFLDERCVAADYPQATMRMLDPWFGCLISALAYAHAELIKHEDIKPNNILIKGMKVFLTDFGTAKDFSLLERSTVRDFLEVGTPIYWAPGESANWGRSGDVFALGCVFSEMLTVRQKRNLQDYRDFRHNPSEQFGYAYKSNLPKVRQWLTKEIPISHSRDTAGLVILEQVLNMMTENQNQRSDALRVKHMLWREKTLFCATCI